MYSHNEQDTIAALSTPLGQGAIAVIRLSGKESLSVVNKVFSKKISHRDHRKVHTGTVHDHQKHQVIDRCVVTYFRAPHSYTGEDVLEISCHCNALIIDQVLQALIRNGARPANPGEFTERAFFNHKIDLSQAEAVADIIGAKTRQSLNHSFRQLEGKLSTKIHEVKRQILNIASLIEVSLDFNEEDIEVYETRDIISKLENVISEIEQLIQSYQYGRLLNEGVRMILLGKPNVGKSSLLNFFLNKDRAIVSEIPGTTRDYIEGDFEIGGIPVRIIDTAGIRETKDPIEELGVKKALEYTEQSDIILALFESHNPLDRDDDRLINFLSDIKGLSSIFTVTNKIDLGEYPETAKRLETLGISNIPISAKEGTHIDILKEKILNSLLSDSVAEGEGLVIVNARHKKALSKALDTLGNVKDGFADRMDEVVLAGELRSALDYIGEIIGETTSEDILNNIFGQFCIGK